MASIRGALRLALPLLAVVLALSVAGGADAAAIPTGETQLGQSLIEPAYNDANGGLVYLLTPLNAPVHPNTHNTAPLYVIM
jgi:hypothetical protein